MIVWLASFPRPEIRFCALFSIRCLVERAVPEFFSQGSIGNVENRHDCRTAGALWVYSRRGDETICLSAIRVACRGLLSEEKFHGKVIWICGR